MSLCTNLTTTGKGHSREVLLHLIQILQPCQEPLVDVRDLPDLLNAIPSCKSSMDSEDAFVSRVEEFVINVLDDVVL